MKNLNIGHTALKLSNRLIVRQMASYDDFSIEVNSPHRHNFFMICLILEGEGIHLIDFEEIEIKLNRLFFVKPQQVHFWYSKSNFTFTILQFSDDYLTHLFDYQNIPATNSLSSSFYDLSHQEAILFLDKIKTIELENTNNRYNTNKIVQATIFILLCEIERFSMLNETQRTSNAKQAMVEKYSGLINKKFKETKSVSEFAERLNITPNYLNIIVKEITGLTANDLINNRIMLEAKRMLINRQTDITQIAYELGFNDASYFTRFFKKHSGTTPTGFRNEIYKMYQLQHN